MSDFEIVKDFDRSGPRRTFISPAVDAVIGGETVFVPNVPQSGLTSRFSRARQAGLKIHTRKGMRDGITGVYVWGEK